MNNTQFSILEFVTRTNWFLLVFSTLFALINLSQELALGIIAGGLIVTINFYLLARTLKKAFTPGRLQFKNWVLAKYYLRFSISGIIIFFLLSNHMVHPLGLILGLSIVVISILLATMRLFTKHLFREAV